MNKKGFTLLELLIVIAIIGILVSIGTVSYTRAQRKSRDSRRQGDLKAVQNALEQYYSDNDGDYPGGVGAYPAGLDTTYLPDGVPMDPRRGTNYCVSGTYDASTYTLCADLEDDEVWDSANECTNQDFCVHALQ
ncbi:type IV pilin protein [Patescibacteria group bacterium]